ncbi:hydroxypyruvate isomerase family protein [Oricola thermophila]|uniref:TIM barrel protein n=1 Tax=Oricola thermophila TaxID=2742145 RepID=A0A6N1VE72_9HYPH|nr:TIM barrel protein [Oricola thermophila]QKV17459.1 TIM barrel protein [Oricola thermophila]
MKLSANLGFLWRELPLPEAIRAAKRAGFDAVECHFPFDVPTDEARAALDETGLPMLGLNTRPGEDGEFGLAALPDREADARAAIEQALDYAKATGCRAVHVMAGKPDDSARADAAFRANLSHACELAGNTTILIEPINTRDVPGYHLATIEQAAEIVSALGYPNLKIMADCYHLQIMGGDLLRRIEKHLPMIGHVQIAAVPSRGRPDEGELNYPWIAAALRDMGYEGYFGAEYRPDGPTEDSLGWMGMLQSR